MEGLIFLVGCAIFSLYVTFFLFSSNDNKKENTSIKIDDAIDYDGHGNWGRFPPKKSRLKEGGVQTNTKPPSKTKKPNVGFMGRKP